MSVPFRLEPESTKRPGHQDPFLEFASERPSRALLGEQEDSTESQNGSTVPLAPAPDHPPSDRRDSAISPTVAFAIGVAGLVTAGVGYYQMGRLLADRSTPVAQTAAAVSVPPATPALPAPPTVGRLEIASDPAGATVKVDGAALGVTPLTLPKFKPGKHEIVMTRGSSTVTRTVELTAGGTATVTAVLATPPPVALAAKVAASSAPPVPANAGFVIFESPIELRILDRGRPRGSTRGRLTLTEGAYDFELVSDIYEIRQSVSAKIGAGRSTTVVVPLPSGSLSINALPWADVWVDGSPVGTTPLANLTLKVGNHAVLFRHPTLGERQETVVVKAVTPARLGVNLIR
jgi:PEGA domain